MLIFSEATFLGAYLIEFSTNMKFENLVRYFKLHITFLYTVCCETFRTPKIGTFFFSIFMSVHKKCYYVSMKSTIKLISIDNFEQRSLPTYGFW